MNIGTGTWLQITIPDYTKAAVLTGCQLKSFLLPGAKNLPGIFLLHKKLNFGAQERRSRFKILILQRLT
ncbi:hypothetical protein [Taibaiella chishuiensis]|uniref:hypothetical protein n=1 Tax=Taibaiella chishuiensis TaxID=1434707 RepID=UPI000D0CD015|nr:hypothetical protein [Taibaiella chishuiensis]